MNLKNAKPIKSRESLPLGRSDSHKRDPSNDNDEKDFPQNGESTDSWRRRRAAELRSEACVLEDGILSTADYYALNGGGPNDHLHNVIWKSPGMTDREKDKLRAQQNQTYHGLAPTDAMERMRARCMVMLESAATGAFMKAAVADDPTATEAYLTMALRSLEGFNKMSERFERARGQPQQQIVVQHNRFDSGSQAVLQTVQADKIENHAVPTPLLGQTIDPLEVATVTAKSPNKKRARCRTTKAS